MVSSVNALDIRNISLSYHAEFFVRHVYVRPIIFRGFRRRGVPVDSSHKSIRSRMSESFIFGNFETDDGQLDGPL